VIGGHASHGVGIFDRATGNDGATRSHAPTSGGEAVTIDRDDNQVRIAEGDVDSRLPVASDEGAGEEGVENPNDIVGRSGTDADA
jgi:hypothetical protein